MLRILNLNKINIFQRTTDGFISGQEVFELLHHGWPKYINSIGFERLKAAVEAEYGTSVIRETRGKSSNLWFHPELALSLVYAKCPQYGKQLREFVDNCLMEACCQQEPLLDWPIFSNTWEQGEQTGDYIYDEEHGLDG
jgi:hypothetical protein